MHDSPLLSRVEPAGPRGGDCHATYLFWCPGCRQSHGVWTSHPNVAGARWMVSGTPEAPSVEPSILVRYGDGATCHCFLRQGQIQYLPDCTHALRGQTVPMRPLPD